MSPERTWEFDDVTLERLQRRLKLLEAGSRKYEDVSVRLVLLHLDSPG